MHHERYWRLRTGALAVGSSAVAGAVFGATQSVTIFALGSLALSHSNWPVSEANKQYLKQTLKVIAAIAAAGILILPIKLGIASSIGGLIAYHFISLNITVPLVIIVGLAILNLAIVRQRLAIDPDLPDDPGLAGLAGLTDAVEHPELGGS